MEAQVLRLGDLIAARQYALAASEAAALLGVQPQNRDLLYLRAHALRLDGDPDAALAALDPLAASHPRFSRLYQERGLCHVARRDATAAIESLLRAVNLNPALPVSWSMLEGLYRLQGDDHNARLAAEHVATLKRLPPAVVTATAQFADGDLAAAESTVRAFLVEQGHHVEAMRLLARIGMRRDALQDAQLLLEAVLQLAPDYGAARYDYAQLLIDRHLHVQALEQTQRLLAAEPHNRAWRTLHALACVGAGRHAEALSIYRELLPGSHEPAQIQLSIAHSLKTLGDGSAAVQAYRAATATRADFGDAWWSLANLKTYRFDDAELGRMQSAEAAPDTTEVDRLHLDFALGKALEDRHDYAASFEYYRRGNALRRAASSYRPELMELNTRLQQEICGAALFARNSGAGAPARDPIFIVGLPRSGSTLLEQILASHPQVEGTQELADVPRLALELQGRDFDPAQPRYPAVLAELAPQDFTRMGDRYLEDTRAWRRGKPRFIDKMPNNFRHVGLIHLILPNAVIIDARREPMACCFSNFKQLFAQGQEFTYSFTDIARYYRTYLELMRHWDTVLPGRVLRVHHEDVVDDLEGSVRRLLGHCGLPFAAACLEFHRTGRSVRTASSEQVRQPINREGLEQWRHYQPWLAPLREALGDALTRYRD
ncbi:MAG: sulfotransferase [Proteobacteria bacterium]|nr:sulfotransferase [Pseudomonadota bacterium]